MNRELRNILIYSPTKEEFNSRGELKKYLGGTVAYNKALKNGDIVIITPRNKSDIII